MADKTIGELERAESVGLGDLFVLEQANQAKSLTGQTLLSDLAEALDGHGGISSISLYSESGLDKTYEIVYADLSVSYFTVTDGNSVSGITQYYAVSNSNSGVPATWYTTMQTMTAINRYLWGYQRISFVDGSAVNLIPSVIGVYGDTGLQTNVYFKWSVNQPQSNSDMIDTPAAWVGVCSTTAPSAPTDYTLYQWYQYKGETGDGIVSISKTGTSGLVDTYTVVLDSGATSTFDVTNGSSIASITKTGTSGIVDTYTVTLTNGQTTTFDVTNGNGVTAIVPVSALHLPGQFDTYRIVYGNGDTFTFDVYNGANGSGAVSSVSGIQPVNGNVPQVVSGSGAPTVLTQGQANQLYFDEVAGGMYFCLGQDTESTDYIWVGTSVAVDSALSTTSENPVQNKVITEKIGTAALNTTAQNLSGAVNELLGDIPAPSSTTPGADTASGAVGIGTTYARADHTHPMNVPSSGTPADLGVAALGSASTYARSDHVHNMPPHGDFVIVSSGTHDFNDYIDGMWYFTGDTTLSNVPEGTNGWLIAMEGNAHVVKQLWYRYGGVGVSYQNPWVRTRNGSLSWGSWYKLALEGDIPQNVSELANDVPYMSMGIGSSIPVNSDLNDYTTPGVFYVSANTVAATISNTPITNAAYRLEVTYLNGTSRFRQTAYALGTSSLSYTRCYTSAGWQPWVALTLQTAEELTIGAADSGITTFARVIYDANSSTVRVYLSARNTSANIPTSAVLGTIPSGYRPASDAYLMAFYSVADGTSHAHRGVVKTDGTIHQSFGSTVREVLLVGEYTL